MVSKTPYKKFTGNSTQWSLTSCPGKCIPFVRNFQARKESFQSYFWIKCSDGKYYRLFTSAFKDGIDEGDCPYRVEPQEYFEEMIHERTFGIISLDTMKGIRPQKISPYATDYIYESKSTIDDVLDQLIQRYNDPKTTTRSFGEGLFKNKIHANIEYIHAFPFSELDSVGWKTPTWLAKRENLMRKFKIHDPPSIWPEPLHLNDVTSRVVQIPGDHRWMHHDAWIYAFMKPATVIYTIFEKSQNSTFLVFSTLEDAAKALALAKIVCYK